MVAPSSDACHSFRPGDHVTVRSAREILATLDDQGTLQGLAFMPEMLQNLGKRYVVSRKVEKTCIDGSPEGMREFRGNDVYFLEEMRCPGDGHGDCGRACMVFWKQAWLRAADPTTPAEPQREADVSALRQRLVTRREDSRYFCQSSDLDDATQRMGRGGRLWKCWRNVALGNDSFFRMTKQIVKPMAIRMWLWFKPRWPSGPSEKTPVGTLDLQPGDWVEVKSVEEITATLDSTGKNRGLQFAYDLKWCCGRKFKVRSRLDHMVLERTGKYLNVKNTVLLDGITCPCRCVIGGCSRADYIYWREIWLKKVPAESVKASDLAPAPACAPQSAAEPARCCSDR